MSKNTFCGYVALIGKPNVGKSTLLNQLVKQKVSITARKPQTTRHQILGINTVANTQIIYVDTPGLQGQHKRALNRYMNRVVRQVISDVDVIVLVLDRLNWLEADQYVWKSLRDANCPVIVVLNKVDVIKAKEQLLPHIAALEQEITAISWVPVSAKTGFNVAELEQAIIKHLPAGPFLFPSDQVTDRSQRFIVAEMIREKLFRLTGAELPYGLTVEIEQFELRDTIYHISGLIWIDKPQHKAMIIGHHGEKLKQVGKLARIDMEKMLENKVFLQLWVKVKTGWADDERHLSHLGYD